ncbi:MAG TPA: iron export ABC transporter permease subunit FetB [Synechococcales cyanobacterium M55_K2018_004]|nr:iron export ABC transporter permease subunit FetB [Synechococcales cyanobacterium M55_K2018_004]
MAPAQLGIPQIIWALGLMAIALGLSLWQRLGLEGRLLMATCRAVVQLLVVGYLLATVFTLRDPWLVLAVLGVMLLTATLVARNRISKEIPALTWLVGSAIFLSTLLTLTYVQLLVVQSDPWYEPQYLIPLAGIVLGNAMNAAAIAGERFVSTLKTSRLDLETHLCLGASPRQAVQQLRREAIQASLIPILNQMLVVGVVTLPGIITGQILAGADPLTAALYQMVILVMLAFADLVTALLVIEGIFRQSFNAAAQLTSSVD